jgi:hypothetical protein
MEAPMMTKRCAYCGQQFETCPQVPDQSFCSSPNCQRARKRQWQRDKRQSDPDYRSNQQAAQRTWTQRNQGYWRSYREAQPKYERRNREQQQSRDTSARNHEHSAGLAKMDVSALPSGIYRISRHPAFPKGTATSLVVEITLLCST